MEARTLESHSLPLMDNSALLADLELLRKEKLGMY